MTTDYLYWERDLRRWSIVFLKDHFADKGIIYAVGLAGLRRQIIYPFSFLQHFHRIRSVKPQQTTFTGEDYTFQPKCKTSEIHKFNDSVCYS